MCFYCIVWKRVTPIWLVLWSFTTKPHGKAWKMLACVYNLCSRIFTPSNQFKMVEEIELPLPETNYIFSWIIPTLISSQQWKVNIGYAIFLLLSRNLRSNVHDVTWNLLQLFKEKMFTMESRTKTRCDAAGFLILSPKQYLYCYTFFFRSMLDAFNSFNLLSELIDFEIRWLPFLFLPGKKL